MNSTTGAMPVTRSAPCAPAPCPCMSRRVSAMSFVGTSNGDGSTGLAAVALNISSMGGMRTIGTMIVCLTIVGCNPTRGASLGAISSRHAISAEMHPANMQSQIDAAVADAARRTGIAAASIKVEAAEAVTWSDGSLGCPQPGMTYTQALVPGYRIRVDAGGQRLEYHAGERGVPAYCPAERVREPVPGAARS